MQSKGPHKPAKVVVVVEKETEHMKLLSFTYSSTFPPDKMSRMSSDHVTERPKMLAALMEHLEEDMKKGKKLSISYPNDEYVLVVFEK